MQGSTSPCCASYAVRLKVVSRFYRVCEEDAKNGAIRSFNIKRAGSCVMLLLIDDDIRECFDFDRLSSRLLILLLHSSESRNGDIHTCVYSRTPRDDDNGGGTMVVPVAETCVYYKRLSSTLLLSSLAI